MSETDIKKGLAGVVVDETTISMVDASTNSLTYRGYPVQDLAAQCSFEDVAWLLWHGELPTDAERAEFEKTERGLRELDDELIAVLQAHPVDCHPMDVLRTAVSYIGSTDADEDDPSPEHLRKASLELLAKLPTVTALEQRRRRGQDPVAPDLSLGYAENFLYMTFGEVPAPEVVKAFETSMILYAEHSFNASTFTARVITSTKSDLYSAVTGAIGALKGPLHGGANEAVMHVLQEIGTAEKAESWLAEARASKKVVMGFGHRVYKNGDSRVPTMDAALRELAAGPEHAEMMELYDALWKAMTDATGIHPNLDYPTGPAYSIMGFDIPLFTPLFVMARITGWTAHIMEQTAANALIRPLSQYTGPERREVPRGAGRDA